MTRLLKYLKPYSWQLVALCLLIFGQTMANLTLPDYMANIVNKGVVGQDISTIYTYGLLMVLVTLAGGICAIGVGYFSARIGAGFARE